jgi:hypothetical protein
MGVYFRTKEGRQGMLDVAMMLRSENLVPYKVQDGNVLFTGPDGQDGMFSVADWAVQNGYSVDKIDGFNTPPTALDIPPTDMTKLDQSVWYMDGAKMDALSELFPQALKLDDGRVVVLDRDGLWKTMWSDTWSPDQPYPSYEDRVISGEAPDTRLAMRSAGIAFLFGLSGVDPKVKNGDIKPESIGKMLKAIARNAPLETQVSLGKLMEQTTGLDQWKFASAINYSNDLELWLKKVSKQTTFDFRMMQSEHAELLVAALHKLSFKDFMDSMNALMKLEETNGLVINAKEAAMEFLSMLHSMDVIRDLSRITGLEEWKQQAEDLVDETKLPPMPSFVPRLVKLLQYVMPMAREKALMVAKGKRGLKAITSLMVLIDACIYSLSDVPDSTAKQKMMMVLKGYQTKLESKLATSYHPINDKKGVKANAFMQAKGIYVDKRETVYKIIQTPKEMWAKTIMAKLREEPNIHAFYDILPDFMAELLQSFVAMDVAYDMQPWIDTNYQDRILDNFATMQDAYGPPPPEYGYLANNSPRASLNIIDTLATAAGMIGALPDEQRRAILRHPVMFANMMQMIQTASIGREIGAVEILKQMGINDPYKSPSSDQIWRDPNQVQAENDQVSNFIMDMMNKQSMQQDQQRLDQEAQMAQNQQGTMQEPEQGGEAQMPPDQMPGAGGKASKSSAPGSGAANGAMASVMSAMGGK